MDSIISSTLYKSKDEAEIRQITKILRLTQKTLVIKKKCDEKTSNFPK